MAAAKKGLQAVGRTVRLAVAQLRSTADVEANFVNVEQAFQQASDSHCQLICLPECFARMNDSSSSTWKKASETQPSQRSIQSDHSATLDRDIRSMEGSLFQRYRNLCRKYSLSASFGGFHVVDSDDSDSRQSNRHVFVDANGNITGYYDKVHLFDVDTDDGAFLESSFTRPGSQLVVVDKSDLLPVSIGLTTCYDLRFPELYVKLRQAGADVVLVPSAFMPSTGEAHWEPLLRARAIETQCYFVAAAQVGQHNSQRRSYGHSMVVDSWGNVVAEASGHQPELLIADLDMDRIASVRKRMPVLQHRRPDVYAQPVRHIPSSVEQAVDITP